MPCDELVDQKGNTIGFICSASVTDMQVLPWECGNCHERLMLVRFESYYGCRSTCLCCGEEFFDDEWAARPQPGDPDCCRNWRKKRIAAARQ